MRPQVLFEAHRSRIGKPSSTGDYATHLELEAEELRESGVALHQALYAAQFARLATRPSSRRR